MTVELRSRYVVLNSAKLHIVHKKMQFSQHLDSPAVGNIMYRVVRLRQDTFQCHVFSCQLSIVLLLTYFLLNYYQLTLLQYFMHIYLCTLAKTAPMRVRYLVESSVWKFQFWLLCWLPNKRSHKPSLVGTYRETQFFPFKIKWLNLKS